MVKFSQKLGFKGYPGLKYPIGESLARGGGDETAQPHEPVQDDPHAAVAEALWRAKSQAEAETRLLNPPDKLEWKEGPASLPKGAMMAVLEGDPRKEGPFVFRVKVPDGYHIPAHTHPKPERVTVISGTFKLAMGELFPGIEVLETQFNDDDANKAASQLQAVFARNPDLAGVFGANLFSAIGAADGVKAVGKSGEIRVVAFDAPQRIVDDIKSGLIDMAIAQHPAEIGYYGVVTAYAAVTGQSVPTDIGTGFTVMDASNIDDPEVRQFVYSD